MEYSFDEFYGGGVVDEVTLVGLARVCLFVFGAARGAAWGRVVRPERCAQYAEGAV